jgi:hypothetical protein
LDISESCLVRRRHGSPGCDCGCKTTESTQGSFPGADEPTKGETPARSIAETEPSSNPLEHYISKIQELLKDDDEETVEAATKRIQTRLKPTAVNIMEHAQPDLMAVAKDEFQEIEIEVALDSGAVDHVINQCDIPGYKVGPSPGSMRGLHFIAANGDVIDNLGQATLNLMPHEGNNRLQSTFQVACVSRPLYSATKIADQGCTISMDKSSAVVTKNGKSIAKFVRKRGLYLCKMTLKAPADIIKSKSEGFQRPATK